MTRGNVIHHLFVVLILERQSKTVPDYYIIYIIADISTSYKMTAAPSADSKKGEAGAKPDAAADPNNPLKYGRVLLTISNSGI